MMDAELCALSERIEQTKAYLASLEHARSELLRQPQSAQHGDEMHSVDVKQYSTTSSCCANTVPSSSSSVPHPLRSSPFGGDYGLTKDDVERFSRQMLCEDLGPSGTSKLRAARVLVIGAGGLGSTVCLYLAAAGVGHLTIVDFDTVERSNLHRQVIHTDHRVGMAKALSAKVSCQLLNPRTVVIPVLESFSVSNAEALMMSCDVVVDATDNVASRYLINDAAVLCRKPLVSGAAMRWEGQLTVYDSRRETSPCYRCLFPRPPPAAAVGSCNDTGVVGPCPGTIGCLQALETIKLLCGCGELLCGKMLLWNGLTAMFKTVKLRPRQATCAVCGPAATISLPLARCGRDEYAMVGGCNNRVTPLPAENRLNPSELPTLLQHQASPRWDPSSSSPHAKLTLLDVRDALQFSMCRLPGSVSLPLARLRAAATLDEKRTLLHDAIRSGKRLRDPLDDLSSASPSSVHAPTAEAEGGDTSDAELVVVICRRGVASSEAVSLLAPAAQETSIAVKNLDGGLNAYARHVDSDFPFY